MYAYSPHVSLGAESCERGNVIESFGCRPVGWWKEARNVVEESGAEWCRDGNENRVGSTLVSAESRIEVLPVSYLDVRLLQ